MALFGDGIQQTNVPRGIAIDPAGGMYVTGQSSTSGLITTRNAFQKSRGGNEDTFVAKFTARRPRGDLNADGSVDLLFQNTKTSDLDSFGR